MTHPAYNFQTAADDIYDLAIAAWHEGRLAAARRLFATAGRRYWTEGNSARRCKALRFARMLAG